MAQSPPVPDLKSPEWRVVCNVALARLRELQDRTPVLSKRRDAARRARATLEREGQQAMERAMAAASEDAPDLQYFAHLVAAGSLDGERPVVGALILDLQLA